MTDRKTANRKPRILLDRLAYVESPRWHDGRLWFAHWGTGEIVAVALEGRSEVMARGPEGLGWSIDWLLDRRLLVTGEKLMRREADGAMVEHADLKKVANFGWNEIVVDGRGNIYVNGDNFDFLGGGEVKTGIIVLVRPDGSVRTVAENIAFPNGMVVTPDNKTLIISESFASQLTAFTIAGDGSLSNRRVWAENIGPDGICLDAEGAIWTHPAYTEGNGGHNACIRIQEGGKVLQSVELEKSGFACMLGGPDRRTLFLLNAEWRGIEKVEEALADRTGQIAVIEAPAPGAGWP